MRISGVRYLGVAGAVLSMLAGSNAFGQASPTPATAAAQTFSIGSYPAVALEDARIQVPNDGKSFVVGHSADEVATVLKSAGAPTDHFELDVHPLLVHAGNRVLLFDTGTGHSFGPAAGKLPESLAESGTSASSVTDIFISHAHGDHVGGLVTASGALAFPNATIHISAPEWAFLSGMKDADAQKVAISNVTALVTAIRPKVVTFQPDAVIIPGVVKAVSLEGHTPGHSGFEIGSGKGSILYIGDSMHSYITSVRKAGWKVAFDMDQDKGAATRVALEKRAVASGQRIYAVHFPFPGVGKFVHEKDGYVWSPETLK